MTESVKDALESALAHLGDDEQLPDLTPAMWLAGAFSGSRVIRDALAADDRNKVREKLRLALEEA